MDYNQFTKQKSFEEEMNEDLKSIKYSINHLLYKYQNTLQVSGHQELSVNLLKTRKLIEDITTTQGAK